MEGVALTVIVIVGIVLLAAFLRDLRDARSGRRAALRDAFERGEIGPEDYARALQSAA